MKNLLNPFYLLTITGMVACSSGDSENKTPASVDKQTNGTENRFAGVQFASQIDTTCGMNISEGAEDTLVLNGQVYGFCSTICKEDFATTLKNQHKR